MTIEPYVCSDDERRRLLRTAQLNAIDYVEVVSDDERDLEIHFLHDLPGTGTADATPPTMPATAFLTADNIHIEGGVVPRVFKLAAAPVTAGKVLKIRVDGPARGFDYSTYRLAIVLSPTRLVTPTGFDPKLASIDFSFKANCPSEFDCKQDLVCPPKLFDEPKLDYLAKDFNTFRRLMLDRLSILMPDWTERHSADLQNTMVDLLAYVADYLSWYQDAVATEAYLGTARKRVSVARHARLLGYNPHEGCNARAFVQFQVAQDNVQLPAHARLLTTGGDGRLVIKTADQALALAQKPCVFETLQDATFFTAQNRIEIYTWQDAQCWLPCGTTQATLKVGTGLTLKPGDFLLFEEVLGPESGLPVDADWSHRQVVRLTAVTPLTDPLSGDKLLDVAWDPADALAFPLCITTQSAALGPPPQVSVARGNLVLADHGLTVDAEMLDPPAAPDSGVYRPRLPKLGVTFAVPYDPDRTPRLPASNLIAVSPRDALAWVRLSDDFGKWTIRRDLLASGRFARDYVVESEDDGTATLRFGDDVLGAAPPGLTQFKLAFRIGSGPGGNLGADALSRVITDVLGITSLSNPLPATGGADPESLTEIRQYAPQAFRLQERAVTEADYATMAERFAGVADAVARIRWTGSWYTAYVHVARPGELPVESDAVFVAALKAHLDRYRMAGVDLEIRGPVFVALDLGLRVCVKSGFVRANVKRDILAALGTGALPDGTEGLFAPGSFTFGTPLYASRVIAAVMAVAGVESVEITTFQRLRRTAAGELAAGIIHADTLEILRLANDPSLPENGRIAMEMWGGQ